jgi:hypothetical protein
MHCCGALQAKAEVGVKEQLEAARRAASQGVVLSDQQLQQVAQEAMNPEEQRRAPSRPSSPASLFGECCVRGVAELSLQVLFFGGGGGALLPSCVCR